MPRAASFWPVACVFVILALLLRLPLLHNADALFGDDEAANALSIKHLVEGRALLLFYYGQRYQGIVEGIAALPFVALLGWQPLAFVCSPLVAWIGIAVLVAEWLWRRWSPAWALAWLLTQLAVPVFQLWASTQAHGGHVWVLFFALAAVRLADGRPRHASAGWGRFAAVQFLGAYTYSYYALFVPLTAGAWVVARGLSRPRAWAVAIGTTTAAIGGVLGLRIVADHVQPDRNQYPDFWRFEQQVTSVGLADRWWVLRRQCLPLALSLEGVCNEYARFHAALWGLAVGREHMPWWLEKASRWLAGMQLGLAVLAACMLARHPVRSARYQLLPVAVCAAGLLSCVAFVLFRYGEQWSRVRYLVPVYPACAMAALVACRAIVRRARGAAWLVCVLATGALFLGWAGYYGLLAGSYYRAQKMIGPDGTLHVIDSPATALARWCQGHGVTGMVGYADYRLAFPVALLTGEKVRFCPWDLRRIPSYAREAEQLDRPWYASFELAGPGGPPPVPGIEYEVVVRLKTGPFAAVLWRPVGGSQQRPGQTTPLR